MNFGVKFLLADMAARPLGAREVNRLLSQPNLLRLGLIDWRDGSPIVHPVWYHYENDRFFVATGRDGTKARSLRKNPNVYFLVDVAAGRPYGVRGKGTARVVDDPAFATEVTKKNVLKYLGTLRTKVAKSILAMGADSCVIEITPLYMATWKF